MTIRNHQINDMHRDRVYAKDSQGQGMVYNDVARLVGRIKAKNLEDCTISPTYFVQAEL